MSARLTRWSVLVTFSLLSRTVVPAWADINNGFRTEWLYASDSNAGTADGGLYAYDDTTGEVMQTVQATGASWKTLTFAGQGTNDARLFVSKLDPLDATNALITELDANGNVVKATDLKTLNGGTSPHATNIVVGNLRYSIFHGTLFLAVNSNAVGGAPLVIHQIDVGLTSILASFTGPIMGLGGSIDDSPAIDINTSSGRIYAASSRMISDTRGGVVGIDTPSGTVTTLIDGGTYVDASWVCSPAGLVYRGNNNPVNQETLVVVQAACGGTPASTARAVMEFYLNQSDGNGNLVKRQNTYNSVRFPGSGQLDEFTGTVMTVRVIDQQSGVHNSGIDQYSANDAFFRPAFNAAINGKFLNNGHTDVDSPGVLCSSVLPQAAQNLTINPGGDAQIQYTLFNKSHAGPLTFTVDKVPADTSWIVIDSSSVGPVAEGASAQVTVTVDASPLAPGQYSAQVTFADHCSAGSYTHARTVNLTVPRWNVNPPEPAVVAPHTEPTDASIVAYLNCLNPQSYTYTVTNLGPDPLSYTVAETDAAGAAMDHAWLTLDKTAGGPIGQGETDTITVTLTGTGNGTEARDANDSCVDCVQNGWLMFTATGFGDKETRQIQMTERWLGGLFGFVRAYLGDVPPFDPGWVAGAEGSCGLGCQFNIIGTETGTVVQDDSSPDPDYNAQNGFALRIDQGTEASPGPHPFGRNGYASDINAGEDGGGSNNAIHTRLGTTMLARVKVIRELDMGANLWIRDDNTGSGGSGDDRQSYGAGCRVRWNSTNNIYEFVNDEGPHAAGNGKADAYHLIRVVDGWGPYGEHVIKVWVDEDEFPNPALEVHGAQAENENAYDAFCFGTFGTTSYSELYYDWVSFTDAGMYGPGEEDSCIGSLLPGACCHLNGTCEFTTAQACEAQGGLQFLPGESCLEAAGVCGPDPYADGDEDGDVDVADFADFQRCMVELSSGFGMLPGCERWDRNADGNIDNTVVNGVSDLGAFLLCSSGPDVPADVCCDGGVGCP